MQELTLKELFIKLNNATDIMDLYYNFNDENYCLYIEITVPGTSINFNGYFTSLKELETQLKIENKKIILDYFKQLKSEKMQIKKSWNLELADPEKLYNRIVFYFSIDKKVNKR